MAANLATGFLIALALPLVSATQQQQAPFLLDPEFTHVSCGSAVKLWNSAGCWLTSQNVNYASGSHQQTISCSRANSPSSLFIVQGAFGGPECIRGTPVKCGTVVRLSHLETGKLLHSHGSHRSPLSGNQEVSAFDGLDRGDDWKLICDGAWSRETGVRLQHVETGKYLSAGKAEYGRPISGHREVAAVGSSTSTESWTAQDGIYFSHETK
ncbi:MIR motif-containing protein [Gaertneriomyces semiglobifer]|nr:MIR motif-containing protein [Gaertneriomyces semiglobifer]